MTLKELLVEIEQKDTALKALLDKDPEGLSLEDAAELKSLDGELERLTADATALRSVEELRQRAQARTALAKTAANPFPHASGTAILEKAGDEGVTRVFATPRTLSKARNFKDRDGKSAEEWAYRAGMWIFAELKGSPRAQQYCKEHGIGTKAHAEDIQSAGGALVPDEFEATLIDLREQFGVFRRYANVRSMIRETLIIPRRTGGLTAFAVGEGTSITESTKSWDNVELVARKWAVLAKLTTELSEDAIIDVANDLAGEIAYAFSDKEDDCGWNGDATAAFHGITGVRTKLLNLSATRANIAGLIIGTGNLWSELLLTDFEAVVGRLPQYADTPRTAWFAHRAFWANVMQKLALAAGGVSAREVIQGTGTPYFLGYPVVVSQRMPSVEANDQVCVLFGDLSQGVLFGDRRSTTLALSEHSDFASDLIAVRGTERMDINFHSPGNQSATASLRVPGPVVGLLTAAS